jgi:hypothetical protein
VERDGKLFGAVIGSHGNGRGRKKRKRQNLAAAGAEQTIFTERGFLYQNLWL